jgi:hypothetical protein
MLQRAVKHQLGDILKVVKQLLDSQQHANGHIRYIRALQLFNIILLRTHRELEDVYFHYVLKPAVRHEINKERLVLPCVYACSAMLIMSNSREM